MMDARSWVINQLVIKTGHRFSGKERLWSTKDVTRISYEESTVFVVLAEEVAEQSSTHPLAPASAAH